MTEELKKRLLEFADFYIEQHRMSRLLVLSAFAAEAVEWVHQNVLWHDAGRENPMHDQCLLVMHKEKVYYAVSLSSDRYLEVTANIDRAAGMAKSYIVSTQFREYDKWAYTADLAAGDLVVGAKEDGSDSPTNEKVVGHTNKIIGIFADRKRPATMAGEMKRRLLEFADSYVGQHRSNRLLSLSSFVTEAVEWAHRNVLWHDISMEKPMCDQWILVRNEKGVYYAVPLSSERYLSVLVKIDYFKNMATSHIVHSWFGEYDRWAYVADLVAGNLVVEEKEETADSPANEKVTEQTDGKVIGADSKTVGGISPMQFAGNFHNVSEIRKKAKRVKGSFAFTSRYEWVCDGKDWIKVRKISEIFKGKKNV